MDGSKDWKRISEALFGGKAEPPSEAFVRGVMGRIEKAEAGPRLVRIPAAWLAPAMGIAAALVLALFPAREAVATGTLLAYNAADKDMAGLLVEEA